MTADVYAGDVAPEGYKNGRRPGSATFNVVADAHPDLLLRIGAALNLLNIAPRVFHMESRPGGTAAVSALVDCADFQAELIARKLQQLTSVRDVLLEYAARDLPVHDGHPG